MDIHPLGMGVNDLNPIRDGLHCWLSNAFACLARLTLGTRGFSRVRREFSVSA